MQTFQPSVYSGSPAGFGMGQPSAAPNLELPVPSVSPGALAGGLAGGLALVVALAALPTFVIEPWIVKQFKPEWGYGKRVAASLGFNIAVGSVVAVARAASGTEESKS